MIFSKKIISQKTSIELNELNLMDISTLGHSIALWPHLFVGKVIALRLELNVKWGEKDGQLIIADPARIEAALPDLIKVLKAGARVAVMYHVEDKSEILGTKFKDNTLIFEYLMKRVNAELGREVVAARVEEYKFSGQEAVEKMQLLQSGEIEFLLLQNVRYDETDRELEKTNRVGLVEPLITYIGGYVDVGTGLMHREQATNLAIKQRLIQLNKPVFAGDLFVEEVAPLKKILDGFTSAPEKSIVFLGGSKIGNTYKDDGVTVKEEGKIVFLEQFARMGIAKIAIGGRMVLPFLVAGGKSVGAVEVAEKEVELASGILKIAKDNIQMPVDYLTIDIKDFNRAVKQQEEVPYAVESEISKGRVQLDIGPKTRELYYQLVMDYSWRFYNGSMGVSENPLFALGTYEIIKALADVDYGFGGVGGGETFGDVQKSGYLPESTQYTFRIKGGGAPLKFISFQGELSAINAMIGGVGE